MKYNNFCSADRKCRTATVADECECHFYELGEQMSYEVTDDERKFYCVFNVDQNGIGDCSACSSDEAFLDRKMEEL